MATKFLRVTALALTLLLLTACGGPAAPAAPADRDSVVVSITTEPTTLDPCQGWGHGALPLIQSTLLAYDTDMNMVCDLATDYALDDTGLVWTFHLRDDVKWEDGVTLTAKHFEEGWARMLNSDTISSFSGTMNSYFENGVAYYNKECDWADVGVKALDDTTLELRLANPAGYLLQILAMTCFSPARLDFIAKHGEGFGGEADRVIACGPFTVESWEHEARLVLVKNPDWYDAAKVNLDKVVFEIVPANDTRAMMFDEGKL